MIKCEFVNSNCLSMFIALLSSGMNLLLNLLQVKYEARKFHDLFFDIMKIAFPDADFREARHALTFPSHGGASSAAAPPPSKLSAAATSQSKLQMMISEAEPSAGPGKPNPRGSVPDEEGRMTRANVSKLHKGSRPDTMSFGRDQAQLEPSLTHPGDLVICKKKRQDRRVGPISPTSQGRAGSGPLSPTNAGRLGPASPSTTGRSVRATTQQKEAAHPAQQTMRWTHQPRQQQSSGGAGGPSPGVEEEVQWAKPVKRMRTDTGKRRPSHL